MHLGNGAITPECGLIALGVAAAGAGVAYASARVLRLDRGRARTAGALGAAVLAAQLFNVQILPFSSVHLIGGVLLAWILGPPLAVLTMTAVLALQALTLGDGGLLALGVNVLNMAIVPALAVAAVRRWSPATGNAAQDGLRIGLTAFAATLLGAALIVVEVSIGRSAAQLEGIGQFAAWMLGAHAVAGILEGVATVALVALLTGFAAREPRQLEFSPARTGVVAVASLGVALLAACGWSSSAPDGYVAALAAVGQSGSALAQIETPGQLSGLGATVQAWQDALLSAVAAPEAVLFLAVTLAAGLAAWLLARQCGAEESLARVRQVG